MKRVLLSLGIFCILLSSAAWLYASDSYTALLNTPVSITGPDGVCKKVTNASATGLSEYIPTVSSSEWQSFINNPPTGVSLASCGCALPWGGTIAEGQTVTAYQASAPVCGSSCVAETRTCTGGVLSGSYTNGSCSVSACGVMVLVGYCGVCGTCPTPTITYAPNGYGTNLTCGPRGGWGLNGSAPPGSGCYPGGTKVWGCQ